jgi:hypothetical protein
MEIKQTFVLYLNLKIMKSQNLDSLGLIIFKANTHLSFLSYFNMQLKEILYLIRIQVF